MISLTTRIFFTICVITVSFASFTTKAQVLTKALSQVNTTDKWSLEKNSIRWLVQDPHKDHIEMSGMRVSAIINYGADSKKNLKLNRTVVWPMLRTIPNDTHASLTHEFKQDFIVKLVEANKGLTTFKLSVVDFDGVLTLTSKATNGLKIRQTLFPSIDKPALVERVELINQTDNSIDLNIPKVSYRHITNPQDGVYGPYKISLSSNRSGLHILHPGKSVNIELIYKAEKVDEYYFIDAEIEQKKRKIFTNQLDQNLILDTPEPIIDSMFRFAKIRTSESIYATKGGLMHGPGGTRYYAAIWANDQAEYVNPLFPFLGYAAGNESALNSFRHFGRFMNDDYHALPSSIISEGVDIWNGKGDRGDCAMVAYGASKFALASGRPEIGRELLPLIDWCIEYNERQKGSDGVIASDTDELEERFPSGEANLSTNVLAYAALREAADIYTALGEDKKRAALYRKRAHDLRNAIESYFGDTVQGFNTYRYYDGNQTLRSWIALPLTVGIFDRKEATVSALLSEHLWTENGILTESGSQTFWDRATLYAFRGIFHSGEVEKILPYFLNYSRKRLLGNHVPYAVEAWPEGNQRHLSAESGLYIRVITEGLFGIEPTGFTRFRLSPKLPNDWPKMALRNIRAFDSTFSIVVERVSSERLKVTVLEHGKPVFQQTWSGEKTFNIQLPGNLAILPK